MFVKTGSIIIIILIARPFQIAESQSEMYEKKKLKSNLKRTFVTLSLTRAHLSFFKHTFFDTCKHIIITENGIFKKNRKYKHIISFI